MNARSILLRSTGIIAALVVMALLFLRPPASRVDFGEWRALVIHSDDWGMEGWFPTALDDSLRAVLSAGVPQWQAAYLASTLETGAEVDSLAALFGALRDSDGLPLILQANTIMAGPTVRAASGNGAGWPVHASGTGPDYHRPGLDVAVDRAIAAGVWWPELHGLTHFNLGDYAEARTEGDSIAEISAEAGVFAYEGFRSRSELDGSDPVEAFRIAREAADRFEARFGRRATSVIAPDYRWGPEDEAAWLKEGLRIVQAKREQVDAALSPHTQTGRLRKYLRRIWFAARGPLFAVERTVDLEPYGEADPAVGQGAFAAASAVEEAWAAGEPGVVSIHRVQLVSTDATVAAAGREQLARMVATLQDRGGVRFLVDAEVQQLASRGYSVRLHPDGFLVRNWGEEPVQFTLPDGREVRAEVGTSVWGEKVETAHQKSRN